MSNKYRRLRGFTLIELAVVLFIIALIGIGSMAALTSFIEASRGKITRQNQDAAKVAIQNFVSRNGRLPCPAVPTNVPSDATWGIEAPTPGTCTGATGIGTGTPKPGFAGTLPWKTLGISTENASDGWNNQFTYAVTRTATLTTFATVGGMRGVLTLHTGTPTSNGLPATGNQINACSTTAGDNSCNLFAAVIVISHGPNGLGSRNMNGIALPAATSALELENTNTGVSFVRAETSTATATYFDDVVMALTPADVLASLIAQGGVKSDYASLQEKFRLLVSSIAANAVFNRTGAAGSIGYPFAAETGSSAAYAFDSTKFDGNCASNPPTSVAFLPTSMQTIVDPWGNQFRYRRADLAIESSETCPTPVVFVSPGPDGNIATGADNYVYYVSLAEFQAIFGLSGW